MSKQPEARHVGGRTHAGRRRTLGGVAIEAGHRRYRFGEHFTGLLVPVIEQSDADRLGERERQSGLGGVVAQQPVRMGDAGDRHAVLRLRIVDRVPAEHRAPRLGGDAQPAAEHLSHQLHRQHAAGPADQVDRHDRAAAHRVNVRERVGGGDPAPVIGIVHHGSEEVRGGQAPPGRRAPRRLLRRRRCQDRPARPRRAGR